MAKTPKAPSNFVASFPGQKGTGPPLPNQVTGLTATVIVGGGGGGGGGGGAAALADWQSRSTGSGVIWAHRFNNAATVQRFTGASTSAIYADLQAHIYRNPNDGIMGDGCLEQFFPQGSWFTGSISGTVLTVTSVVTGAPLAVGNVITDNNNNLADGTKITSFGTGSGGAGTYNLNISQNVASEVMKAGPLPQYGWIRPLFPMQASALGPADINNAGLPVLPSAQYETGTLSSNNGKFYPDMVVNYTGGGHFVHPDYLNPANQTWNAGAGTQLLHGGEFWIQYRVKFSATRFSALENNNPVGDGTGKNVMLTGFYANCAQEIVLQSDTNYGGGWFRMYTNVGSNFNSFLYSPQDESGSPVYIQPGGRPSCQIGAPGVGLGPTGAPGSITTGLQNCWCYLPDEWITMMIHVVPGHQGFDPGGEANWLTDPVNAGSKDTKIEVFAAYPGDTAWTTVASKSDFIFQFVGDYITGANQQPFGWAEFNLTPFNGGPGPQPVMSATGYYHRFDQIICSTQPIPLPKDFGNGPVIQAPAWFTSMADKTWKQIGVPADFTAIIQQPLPQTDGNSSGPTEVVGAFSGSAVDQSRGEQLFVANGGHNGYVGNEVYAFAVRQATPKWYLLTQRTPDASIDYTQPAPGAKVCYLDGLPRAMHSWNVPVFAENCGKVFYPYETDYSSGLSGNSDDAWYFDRDQCLDNYANFPVPYATVAANAGIGAGYWRYLGHMLGGVGPNEGSEACWDPQNNLVVWVDKLPQTPAAGAAKTLFTIDPVSLAVTYYNVTPASGNPTIYWAACTRGLSSNVMVCGDYLSATDIYLWDLSNRGTSVLVRKIATGSSGYTSQSGWYPVWHEASKAFLLYDQSIMGGGSTIVKLAPTDPNNPLTTSWVFSNVTANAANTVIPPVATNPSWSKFNIIRDMGNGQGCLIVNSWDQGVYVYKLPAAGI